jgi:DUF971 family protein
MGLLDKISPQKPKPLPTDLGFEDDGTLRLRWDDGKESRFAPKFLRGHCPCAECVEEWSGRRVVGESQVPDEVKPRGMHEVGRYAMQIDWSDGHSTGIYSWDYLWKLREAEAAPPVGTVPRPTE